ncbi:MAG TPA: peptide chain release factor N(5)-glutamine methyltransferase [Tepidisphaeraceae bacterium]|jgi:release factor glutamine methyltransferase
MAQTDAAWTVERILSWTRGFFERKKIDAPRLCAELLVAHVLAVPRIKLYTDFQRVLDEAQLTRLRDLVKRAGEEEPIAYLTGVTHFFNCELHVRSGVLIPRPDTETLVEQAMALFRNVIGFESPRVLDLCTGSGAVAVAIAKHAKASQIVATDISEVALEVARQNAQTVGVADRVTVLGGDLYEALKDSVDPSPFDLIVANPPYIATGQIAGLPRNVRDYEPHLALDGGPDGLGPHRRILQGAQDRWLRDGGRVMLEIAFDQQESALAMIAQYPAFSDAKIIRDYAGQPRVLVATKGAVA